MADRRTVVALGPEGERGRRGRQGLSAYEVAVDEGFTGTRRQWLDSLRGSRGERGPQGPDGQRGMQGPKGDPGPAAEPQMPLSAAFERDDVKHLTERVLVTFPTMTVEIVPTRDDLDYMTGAVFRRAA